MNKRGQGLPLTTIIIAILVVVVLIVIVAFFLGSSSGIVKSIKDIFFKTTAGTDLTIAVQSCVQYCEQAKGLPTATLKQNSAYCSTTFSIDQDNNGEADYIEESDGKRKFYEWHCERGKDDGKDKYLSVDCDLGYYDNERENSITCDSTPPPTATP